MGSSDSVPDLAVRHKVSDIHEQPGPALYDGFLPDKGVLVGIRLDLYPVDKYRFSSDLTQLPEEHGHLSKCLL